MANLKDAVRTAQSAETLETVDIVDVIKFVKGVDFQLVKSNDGVEYLHVVNKNSEYISLKVGNKVSLTEDEPKERVTELINDYIIYCGESDNGPWFTFGPEPRGRETVTVSIASVLGKGFKVA